MLEELLKSFITLFVIMDPFGGIPIFISLTKGFSEKDRIRNANSAIGVAAGLLFIFLFFGVAIFSFFGISTSSFMIAGGIILLVLGVMYVLGITSSRKTGVKKIDIGSVPIGTPLLTGPGVITSTIILVQNYGIWIPFIAAILTLCITWLIFRYSTAIYKFIGEQGSEILSRVMGIILAAIAVEFIRKGILGFVG